MELFYTQETARKKIEKLLLEGNIIFLYGKSGAGKSSLIKEYFKGRKEEIVIIEYSNNSYRNSSLQNIKLAICDSKSKVICENEPIFIEAVAQDLPIAKNSFLYIINRFKNRAADMLNAEYLNVFSEDEKSIIMKLVSITNKKPLLLVFDNYHWANINDINFLNNLNKICGNKNIFQNSIKIIIIATTNQNENPDLDLQSLIEMTPSVNLEHVSVEKYSEILKLMGLKESLSERVVNAIYSMTSGHLELTKKVIDYTNMQAKSFFSVTENIEDNALIMMTDIFEKMIKFFFKDKQSTIDFLGIASVIGNIFNQYELKALTEDELFLIEKHISSAANEHFIEVNNDSAQFIHPIIRELFYKKLDDKRYSYHLKYASELKHLKPTEHLERAFHYEICKEEQSALQESITAYLIHILTGSSFPESIYRKIRIDIKKQRIEKYFNSLEQAYKSYVSGQIEKSIKYLDEIDEIDITNDYYTALKNYIYARNILLFKYDTNSFTESANLLKTAGECFFQSEELEMYINTLMILLNIYAYKLCDIPSAKDVEKKIVELFRNELSECHEPKIEDYRYEYKRKSVSLCTPEIAYKRAKEAFEYFKKSSCVMELYKSACDFSATCIFMGEFKDALTALEDCGKTVDAYKILVFPELFKPQSNFILASLYSNPVAFKEHLEEAIITYRNILKDNPYITKIVNVNLAGLLLLAERYSDADYELHSLEGELADYKNVLYKTLIYGNLASLNILQQDYGKALDYLDLVDAHLSGWDDGIRSFYSEQAGLLRKIAQEKELLTPHQLFMRPLNLKPEYLGSTWKFIGRGILFSELLFYTT